MPASFEAAVVALLAIVPGFIATTIWVRAKTWKGHSGDLRTVLGALAVSAAIQVLLLPYTLVVLFPERERLEDHPIEVAIWLVMAILILPIVGGRVAAALADRLLDPVASVDPGTKRWVLSTIWKPLPPPTIWDWLWTNRPPHGKFVVVEFSDGRRVAGVFSEGALAITSPEPHGLFLSQEWIMDADGNVTSPLPGSMGLMVVAKDVRSVRILEEGRDAEQ